MTASVVGSIGVVAGDTQVVVVVVDVPVPAKVTKEEATAEVTYEEEAAALDVVLKEIADIVEELAA